MEKAGIAVDAPYLQELSREITDRLQQVEIELNELAGTTDQSELGPATGPAPLRRAQAPLRTAYQDRVLGRLRGAGEHSRSAPHRRTAFWSTARWPNSSRPTSTRCRCRSTSAPAACTPRTIRRSRRPAVSPRPTPICRISRFAPSWGGGCGGPSSPTRGRSFASSTIQSSSRPTTRRSSCDSLAHLSEEQFLIDAFARGDDIHRATAAVIHGVPSSDVTPDMRRVAKTVNFGIIYGMQAHGLSRDTGLSRQEAQRFIDQYWANLPQVKRYFDSTLGFGIKHGYVESIYGRRRILGDLTSANYSRRAAAERMAVNMPLQGSASDIMKLAMIKLDRELARSDLQAKLLLQVHDELVLEVEREDVPAVADLLTRTMETTVDLRVPLETEVRAGLNWDDLAPVAALATSA